jgi:hypothetical protein
MENIKLTSGILKKAIRHYLQNVDEYRQVIWREYEDGREVPASKGFGDKTSKTRLVYNNYLEYLSKSDGIGNNLQDIVREKKFKSNGYVVRWYYMVFYSGYLAIYEKDEDIFAEWVRVKGYDINLGKYDYTVVQRVKLQWDVKASIEAVSKK